MLLTKFGREAGALQVVPEDILFAILRTADMLRQGFCIDVWLHWLQEGS